MTTTTARDVDLTSYRTPPFEGAVALSLSGGGFRAAGFHLGVLVALQRCGLLERTKVLSSVSGGSLIALRLMLGLSRGESFDEIRAGLVRFLTSSTLVPRLLERSASEGVTLTRALADELDGTLFSSARHASATMREIYEARLHIAEGSFTASEIRSGRPFRFSFSRGALSRIGNQEAHLPRRIAEELRLADVAAATCAFPGMFEPMVVPTDFKWPDPETARAAAEALGGREHGLIDGGVHDNQGIDSMLVASERLGEELGLAIVSDADRTQEAPEPRRPSDDRPVSGLKIWQLDLLSLAFSSMAFVSLGLLAAKVQVEREMNDFRWASDGIAFGVPAAFCALSLAGLLYVRWRVKRAVAPLLPHLDSKSRRAVRRMRIGDLINQLQVRFRTLEAVTSAVFPRRLRGLVYRETWSARRLADRRVAIQMGSLSRDRVDQVDGLSRPSEALINACKLSASTARTLRLASREELDNLVRSGQATAILRIVEALEVQFGSVRDAWPASVRTLDAALRADWDALNRSDHPLVPR